MADSRTFLQLPNAVFKPHNIKHSSIENQQNRGKNKLTAKKKIYKCSQKCKKHLFALRRKDDEQCSTSFSISKYGMQHKFCPSYNKLIGLHEGGIPEFNSDCKIDTPSFVSKFDKVNSHQTTNRIYRQRFQQNLAKATNSTLDSADNFRRGLTEDKFNKIKDSSLNQTIAEFMRFLRVKEQAGLKSYQQH